MFKKIILITFIFIISTSCFAQNFYIGVNNQIENLYNT